MDAARQIGSPYLQKIMDPELVKNVVAGHGEEIQKSQSGALISEYQLKNCVNTSIHNTNKQGCIKIKKELTRALF